MFARLRNRIAIVLCGVLTMASGLASGIALACSGNYCGNSVRGCMPLYETVPDTCCKDFDGDGVRHCVTCSRDRYWCPMGVTLGPAYGCSNAGAVCT